jgi:hypothetical protein
VQRCADIEEGRPREPQLLIEAEELVGCRHVKHRAWRQQAGQLINAQEMHTQPYLNTVALPEQRLRE